MVKNLPAMQETQVRSWGWEDPSEKGMATHSRMLAWRIPWTEEPGRLQSTILISNYQDDQFKKELAGRLQDSSVSLKKLYSM